ncbi:MAG: electron transfer flavoprotein subunit alpha/FixB family protein [Thermoplasmatota archaeon]
MTIVYADKKTMVFELLKKAAELSKETIAVIIGEEKKDLAVEYISYGADKVIMVETDVVQYKAEEYAEILKQLIEENKTETVLIGSDKNGKELASRLAGILDTGCVIDATNVSLKDDKITTERVVYSGNAVAVEQFNTTPAIITVPSKVFDPIKPDTSRKGEIITKKISPETAATTITNISESKSDGVSVEDAEIIVSCGRGFKNKDDLKYATDLADVLKGKTVGCSRPIAADLKWLPEEHWIGLSGHKVKPQLYIAAGISGQIQHIAGMRDSGVVVAVNKDPEALIFNSADYGIVGDLYNVLPKLTTAIKEKME